MSYKKQELLTLLEHLSSPPAVGTIRVDHLFLIVVLSYYMSLRSEFRVVLSYYIYLRSEFRVVVSVTISA